MTWTNSETSFNAVFAFRAIGITKYLQNGGKAEVAQYGRA
jgi:hypothetical protein